MDVFLPWLFLFLGAFGRILLPFLYERRDNPDLKWEWRYVYGQAISLIIFVLVLPVLVDNLAGIVDLELQQAFLVGYGAAAFGRLGDKRISEVVEVVRNGR